jgi:hypothetical protein
MSELSEWLENRQVNWNDFLTYRAILKEEELRRRAKEDGQCCNAEPTHEEVVADPAHEAG